MTLKSDAKIEEKLTCCLEKCHEECGKFSPERKYQNWNFDGILLPKAENV